MDYDICIDLRSQATNHPLDVNLDILSKAADEIESLRQQLAEQPIQDKRDAWVSVDDRLPDNEYKVVIVYVKGEYFPSYLYVGTCNKGKWMVDNDSRINGITGRVTHWMPLPDTPHI